MKNTMKKVLCTLLTVLLCVTVMPLNIKADAAYVLTEGVCMCEDHDDYNPCHCCLWCENLDTLYVQYCVTRDEEGHFTVCCETCNGLFDCVCACSCCDRYYEEPPIEPGPVIPLYHQACLKMLLQKAITLILLLMKKQPLLLLTNQSVVMLLSPQLLAAILLQQLAMKLLPTVITLQA